MLTRGMIISELAALAGVPVATVRYYERRGLIAPAPRSSRGYRQYGPETARRLRFIKHAQGLGFALEEIQSILDLRRDDPAACAQVEATAREKIRTVQKHLEELRQLERVLLEVVSACEQQRESDLCPMLLALTDDVEGVDLQCDASACS